MPPLSTEDLAEHAMRAMFASTPGLYPFVENRCRDYLENEATQKLLASDDMLQIPEEEQFFIKSALGYIQGYKNIADRVTHAPMMPEKFEGITAKVLADIAKKDGSENTVDHETLFQLMDFSRAVMREENLAKYQYAVLYAFVRGAQQAALDDVCGELDEQLEKQPHHKWANKQRERIVENAVVVLLTHEMIACDNIFAFAAHHEDEMAQSFMELAEQMIKDLHCVASMLQESRVAEGEVALSDLASAVWDMASTWVLALESALTGRTLAIEDLPDGAREIVTSFVPMAMSAGRSLCIDIDEKVVRTACAQTTAIEQVAPNTFRAIIHLPRILITACAMNYANAHPDMVPSHLRDEFEKVVS